MMVGLTGTPGTGKSSVAAELERRGHRVVHLVDTVQPYILEEDRALPAQTGKAQDLGLAEAELHRR